MSLVGAAAQRLAGSGASSRRFHLGGGAEGVEKPPVGTDRLLDSAQIRYCLTEKISLKRSKVWSAPTAIRNRQFQRLGRRLQLPAADSSDTAGDDVDRVQSEIEPKSAELAQVAKTKWVRNALGLTRAAEQERGNCREGDGPKKPAIPKNSHLDYFGHD